MALRDTTLRYGTLTRVLHWTIAALLMWQFGGMIYKNIAGRTPLTAFWVGSHVSIGSLLLTLIVLRVLWAIAQRRNRPPHRADPVGRLAKAGHIALYVLMVCIPCLGILRAFGDVRPVQIFGVTLRGPMAEKVEWMTAPADALHGNLAWLFLAFIAGHIVMALVHGLLWRDGTLRRMIGRSRR